MEHIVVVGASLAGLRACETLREEGFTGRLTLVGAEPELPYDRPPLSKKLLGGEWEPERIRLRKTADFESLDLDLRLGVTATALDTAAKTVALRHDDEAVESMPYEALIVATGAGCRQLPNQPRATGIFELRTLADSLSLRQALSTQPAVVVIGAGFIGLEVAATARQKGCEVIVLEGAPAPLIRGLGAEMGSAVVAVHARNGVDIRCSVVVAAIEVDEATNSVVGVRLGDGTVVAAGVVVVGIGVAPALDWLQGSGLTLGDGIVCDETLWTGIDGVYAAGDCARWVNRLFGDPDVGEHMRVEHWTNAAEQGVHAARNILAVAAGQQPVAYETVPFFWSDHYDRRIQFLGRVHGDDEVQVVAGSVDDKFVALYGHGGRLRGVLGLSMPKMLMPYRQLLARRISWEEALDHAQNAAGR
jgi:NADPH-dependent 2,4-dienoyl-CoA reductase/sulfur reductase-like enzyme